MNYPTLTTLLILFAILCHLIIRGEDSGDDVLWLCVRWGFPSLKPIDNTKFNLSKNDYR